MTGLIFGAFVGGLTGSPHCVGMCGGFSVAASDAPVAYHLGRLGTYVVLGSLAGAFGAAIPGPPWVTAVISGGMLLYFSLRLAGVVPAPHLPNHWIVDKGRQLVGKNGWPGRLALGATTALLPCGLVWAAMGIAVGAASAPGGALTMGAFWLGTVPLLAGVSAGFHRMGQTGRKARLGMAGVVFAAGLWSISHRIPAADAAPDEPPACHAE